MLRVSLERFARSQDALQSKKRRGWKPLGIAPRRNHPEPVRFNDLKAAPPKKLLHVSLRRWATGPPANHIAPAMAQPGDAPLVQMIVYDQNATRVDNSSQPVENAFTQMVLGTQNETEERDHLECPDIRRVGHYVNLDQPRTRDPAPSLGQHCVGDVYSHRLREMRIRELHDAAGSAGEIQVAPGILPAQPGK